MCGGGASDLVPGFQMSACALVPVLLVAVVRASSIGALRGSLRHGTGRWVLVAIDGAIRVSMNSLTFPTHWENYSALGRSLMYRLVSDNFGRFASMMLANC